MCQILILENKEISSIGQLKEELCKRYPKNSEDIFQEVLCSRNEYDGSDWDLENPNTCLCDVDNLSVARKLDCKILVDYSTNIHILYPIKRVAKWTLKLL